MNPKDEYLNYEEDFFSNEWKLDRKERKLASSKDRSKFKKSDQDQLKKQEEKDYSLDASLIQGRVLAITPDGILVACNEKQHVCTLKGALKKERSRFKNLIAVGDSVWLEEAACAIVKIDERRSILSRADNLSRNKEQLIAVNIDQVIITCSVVAPLLKTPLVDRYIIAARKGNMEPVIVVNKIDLLQNPPLEIDPQIVEQERELLAEFLTIYRALNLTVIPMSADTGEGIDALKKIMHGKTSVFSGQSGVGKSRLVNLITGLDLATGAVVKRTSKGSHTTTTTQLICIAQDSFCIDTPGIKSFGIWDVKGEEIKEYFSEIYAESGQCKFPDCAHINEPSCAVKEAVEEGKISSLRFASYCALMAHLQQEHGRR